MHLVHQNEPGYCWGDPKAPPVIKTNSGRKRLNILGAYHPAEHSLVHLTGEDNCDAARAIEFLDRVEKAYHLGAQTLCCLLITRNIFMPRWSRSG